MILIADSGSTKTDWCLVAPEKHVIWHGKTKGLNPYFLSEEELFAEIHDVLLPKLGSNHPNKVFFYGAGCIYDKAEMVHRVISRSFLHLDDVLVHSDLMAAVHSLCGTNPGIACILGTGSNACFYDGREVIRHISPLGFILGDEGSGAVLGKLLVGGLLKGVFGSHLKDEFLNQYNFTESYIIDRVYRQPFPSRFLASLTPFIRENIMEHEMHRLVLDSFIAFIERNILPLDCKGYEANFVGSVGYYFKEILQEAADKVGIKIGKIIQSPMDGLIAYHLA